VVQLALAAAVALSAPVWAQQKPSPQSRADQHPALPEGDALLAYAQEDPAGAIRSLSQALGQARRDDPGFPSLTHLAWLDAYGLALVRSGQLVEAAGVYQELGILWGRQDDVTPEELAELRLNLQTARTRFAEALSGQARYSEAERIWAGLAAEGRGRIEAGDENGLYPVLQLGNTLFLLGRQAEAEQLLRDTLDLSSRVLGREHLSSLVAMQNLAEIVFAQGRREVSLPLYRDAAEIVVRTQGADHPLALLSRRGLAANLSALGQYDEAQLLLEDVLARQVRLVGADNIETLRTQNAIAANLMNMGRNDEALAILLVAEPGITSLLGEQHPDTLQVRQNIATLRRLAGADVTLALAEARASIAALREQRRRLVVSGTSATASRGLTPAERTYYDLLIDAGYNALAAPGADSRALAAEAFEAVQEVNETPASTAVARRTARSLAVRQGGDILARLMALEDLAEQYGTLLERRNAQLTQAAADRPQAMAVIEQQLAQADAAIVSQTASLERDFPAYGELVRAPPIALRDAFAMVEGTDDAIVVIMPGFLGTHIFALDAEGFSWARSDLTTIGLNGLVRRLLWDVGASIDVSAAEAARWEAEGEGAYPFDRTTAHRLYTELIAPVSQRLAGSRHLYIAAGGSLASLPLGMLVTEAPLGEDGNPADLKATRWLADDYALVQLPSLHALQFQRRFGAAAGQSSGFIGIGDPVLDGAAVTRGGGGRRNGGNAITALQIGQAFQPAGQASSDDGQVNVAALKRLARLPGTALELEQMRQVLGAGREAVLTGAAATETAVKQADLSQAAIVAFATHGLLAGEVDGAAEPGLVLTPPDVASPADDGLLTMSEITNLRLNAQWVILSACNTAAGDGTTGAPGLSGLAKAFFLAGAQSILASHWPVRDDVAARLTVRTIAIARDNPGLSRAEALQRAMREIRNDPAADSDRDTWAHPNAWAPFTLIGDAG
jgi:CHAT domain-containing protein